MANTKRAAAAHVKIFIFTFIDHLVVLLIQYLFKREPSTLVCKYWEKPFVERMCSPFIGFLEMFFHQKYLCYKS